MRSGPARGRFDEGGDVGGIDCGSSVRDVERRRVVVTSDRDRDGAAADLLTGTKFVL